MIHIEKKKVKPLELIKDMPLCVEDCMATLAGYYHQEHELMFLRAWQFDFVPSEDISQIQSNGYNELDEFSLLAKWYGLRMKKYEGSKELLGEFIDGELEKENPVFLGVDAFYCSWDSNYQLHHALHCLIINGHDHEKKRFHCVDAYYNKAQKTIFSEEELYKCYYFCYFCELHKVTNDWSTIPEEIISCAGKMICDEKNRNHFERMREFAHIFERKDITLKQLDQREFWVMPLFRLINWTISCRHKYTVVMEYCAKKNGMTVNAEILKAFEEVISIWNVVRGILIKAFYCPENSQVLLARVSKKIAEAANKEEQIAHVIIESGFLANAEGEKKTKTHRLPVGNDSKDVMLDLSEQYNNKGMDIFPPRDDLADFTSCGHYYILPDEYEKETFQYRNVAFRVRIGKEKENDNISCMGQEIAIPNAQYRKLYLMYSSEYGSYPGTIQFCQGEEKEYERSFITNDWSDALNEDTFVWKSYIATRKNGNVVREERVHKIFLKEIELEPGFQVDKVKLPNCINIHIFAMTLESCC